MTALKIIDIEGIGPAYAEKLQSIKIKTSDELLKIGKTPKGRKEIADQSRISEKLILKWVNMADLIRIKGVGEEYSELLEEAGVDTVVELSHRNAKNLQEKMQQVNEKKNLVRRPPTLNEIKKWIVQAKKLPRVIEYSSSLSSTATETKSDNEPNSSKSADDLTAKIIKLEEKLDRLSVSMKSKSSNVNLTETQVDSSEIINPKGTLPKGF